MTDQPAVRLPWSSQTWGLQSHEGAEFEASYSRVPSWDIGRPQPALLHLAGTGQLVGAVLDVGCGTGEHALMAAAAGRPATGVDISPTAIDTARQKATDRSLDARFQVLDVLDLAQLGERFDTALDCGLFHVLPDEARVPYAAALRAVLSPGGRYHLLCFSDRQPGYSGPRRISRADLHATFTPATGWHVDAVEPATIELTDRPPAQAWHATLTRP